MPAVSDVKRLRVFLEVAQQLSFSRAAERLFLTQPAVSKQIKGLERAIGGPLFDHRMRNLQLTELGRTLQVHARQVLADLDALESAITRANGEIAGNVTVAADEGWDHVLPGLLIEFKLHHPRVALTLIRERDRGVFDGLAENRFGLGFVMNDPRDARFETTTISEEELPLAAIVPAGHALASLEVVPLEELGKYPFVFFPADASSRVLERLAGQGAKLNYAMRLATVEGILQAVEAGIGITALWDWAVDFAGGNWNVEQRPLAVPPVKRTLLAVKNRARSPSVAEEALLTYIRTHFKAPRNLR